MRTMLQIGLGPTAEGLYLAHPDRDRVKHENSKEVHGREWSLEISVPKGWRSDEWQYFGVDSDRYYIGYHDGKYGQGEKWQWILAYVSNQTYHRMDIHPLTHDIYHPPHISSMISLKDLLFCLGITKLDIFAGNLNCEEFSVFEAYDFSVRPKCLFIKFHDKSYLHDTARCHSPEARQALIDIISPHDYKVLGSGCTDKHLFFVDEHIDEEIVVER